MEEASENRYEGGKEFGRFCGQGTLELEDGKRYEGEFFNGQFHGEGTLFFAEGRFDGTWEHGKQVDGKFTFSDGLQYAAKEWSYCGEQDRRFQSEILEGKADYRDTSMHRVMPTATREAIKAILTNHIVSYSEGPTDANESGLPGD